MIVVSETDPLNGYLLPALLLWPNFYLHNINVFFLL